MNYFIKILSDIAPLSQPCKEDLMSCLRRRTFPKGYELVKREHVCKEIFFIERGLARTYYIKDGKEITEWINTDNSFASSFISLWMQAPDKRIIELLEPSEVWMLHIDELESLYEVHPDLAYVVKRITCHEFMIIQQRLEFFYFSTALERYQLLMEHNPVFLQKVPLGIIASYLGMTQETLSRVRRQIS